MKRVAQPQKVQSKYAEKQINHKSWKIIHQARNVGMDGM